MAHYCAVNYAPRRLFLSLLRQAYSFYGVFGIFCQIRALFFIGWVGAGFFMRVKPPTLWYTFLHVAPEFVAFLLGLFFALSLSK